MIYAHPRTLTTLLFFEHNLEELDSILGKQYSGQAPRDALSELCLIGLAAYFEAFCKDLFAALVNIYPELLEADPQDSEIALRSRRGTAFDGGLTGTT